MVEDKVWCRPWMTVSFQFYLFLEFLPEDCWREASRQRFLFKTFSWCLEGDFNSDLSHHRFCEFEFPLILFRILRPFSDLLSICYYLQQNFFYTPISILFTALSFFKNQIAWLINGYATKTTTTMIHEKNKLRITSQANNNKKKMQSS